MLVDYTAGLGQVRCMPSFPEHCLTVTDEASYQDRQRLLKDYNLKSIIDLRTKSVTVSLPGSPLSVADLP